MKSVPEFKACDRVRVMQTDDMVMAKYANLRGVVIATWSDPDGAWGSTQICRVQIENSAVNLPASVLMKL